VRFADRRAAGDALAPLVAALGLHEPVVLGLPRGGAVVAARVAAALGAPLDGLVVRKLGAPSQPELGLGAIGEGGVRVLNQALIEQTGAGEGALAAVEAAERALLDERRARYRAGRPAVPLAGRDVVIVDDGIATGGTARAAVAVARARGARRVVLAAPVAAPDTVAALRAVADDVVTVLQPDDLVGVGRWYRDFRQTTDDEVVELLARLSCP
jgi:putative phosphoribosyl transferase